MLLHSLCDDLTNPPERHVEGKYFKGVGKANQRRKPSREPGLPGIGPVGGLPIAIVNQVTLVIDDFDHLWERPQIRETAGQVPFFSALENVRVKYRADESRARLHGAQTSVSDLKGQDLGTGGHAVALGLLWEVTRSDACNVCPVGAFSKQKKKRQFTMA